MERRVNAARERLSDALGVKPEELLYTSGATEANNAAIRGAILSMRGKKRIITDLTEHPSVYETFRLFERSDETELVFLGTGSDGRVCIEELKAALTENTALVSIMQVNNETGAINDIFGAYAAIRRYAPKALFHIDGVQAFCKLPFTPVPCDMYSISGHKFHAPKGVGALYLRKGARFAPTQVGGGQERNLRSGTLNVPGILAMDAALAAYRDHHAAWMQRMRACKTRLYKNLSALPDVLVNGPAPDAGAGHILNMSFMGVRGEVLLNALSDRGILVSTGSACSAHRKGNNRVLSAIGVTGARQEGAIRFSFCPFTTLEEIDTASAAVTEIVTQLRRYKRR
ncbi:MAG: cysteine desulfurase family protein [Clostridia bacterium]|nr:cysteine desulfurase family protein [Clostridia bacterium]